MLPTLSFWIDSHTMDMPYSTVAPPVPSLVATKLSTKSSAQAHVYHTLPASPARTWRPRVAGDLKAPCESLDQFEPFS